MNKKEESLQIQICNYLRSQYPDVLWTCDLSSGLKLTIGQAVKAQKMRERRGYPDMMIHCPKGKYHGLVIELKKADVKLVKKDGITLKDDHIKEQHAILKRFANTGYKASFGIGFNATRSIIDQYMMQGEMAKKEDGLPCHASCVDDGTGYCGRCGWQV